MNLSAFSYRLCIAAFALMTATAWADPPARVGRISYLEGTVSFYGDREEGWNKAQLNYPVTTENSLWTEGEARAEVRIGPSAIRLNDETIFDFVTLEDDTALGYLQRGSVNVRLRQFGTPDNGDTLQIDTNEGRFTFEGNGRYRVDASPDNNESRITVFSGRARFVAAGGEDTRLSVDAGKQLIVRISGTATDFRYDTAQEAPFDRWADDRDRQWDQTHQRYTRGNAYDPLISPYMTGYEDLDANGDWIEDNEYGRVWAPRVAIAGWAPYRYGRWSYVRPWGWTWIDDAPWGFAPFHYGRWVQLRSRWCWWPGPYIGRPVYAPALVAWIGGPGRSLTISSGPAVGWFPLAPREYYVPRYTTNANYLRRINYVTNNNTRIVAPTRFRNQVPGATVVPNQVFVNGNPVGTHRTHVTPQALSGHAPIASLDIARPPRSAFSQLPDRRQENRPASPSPRPHFANEKPLVQIPGQERPRERTQAPKYRSPEPAAVGPLPAPRAAPESVKVPREPVRGGALPAPMPQVGANPANPGAFTTAPVPQQQRRQQPATIPSQPATVPNAGAVRTEPAPSMPDRESRAANQRPRNRPQADAPSQQPVRPQSAPAPTPRQPTAHPQPAIKAVPPPQVKQAPVQAAKPVHQDHPDANKAKAEIKERAPKPGVPKD